jgi:hypothetical protein
MLKLDVKVVLTFTFYRTCISLKGRNFQDIIVTKTSTLVVTVASYTKVQFIFEVIYVHLLFCIDTNLVFII